MKMRTILLIVLSMFLFVEIASANDAEDLKDTIDTIDDTAELIDITMDEYQKLKELQKDPTNTTLLVDNIKDTLTKPIEPLTGPLDDFDVKKFERRIYIILGIAIFSALVTPLLARLK